jgi:serine/threonine protein kinase
MYSPDKITLKQVKIIDFGFANFLANLQDPGEMSETLCGTTNYLAPETLEMKPLTFKVDNFALGVIMYKMIAGL